MIDLFFVIFVFSQFFKIAGSKWACRASIGLYTEFILNSLFDGVKATIKSNVFRVMLLAV